MTRYTRLALVVACLMGCESKPEVPVVAAPAKAPTSQPAVMQESLTEHMDDHFDQVTQARDAIIRGKLEAAQAALLWLEKHSDAPTMPAAWKPHTKKLRQAAGSATDTADMGEAARRVAAVAQQCGDCHRALNSGPKFEPTGWSEGELGATEAAARAQMHRHLWAADRLWEGLIGPWDAAWKVGAEVLADPPEGKLEQAMKARVETLRALALRAGKASGAQRATVYGELLTQCATCHTESGVDPAME